MSTLLSNPLFLGLDLSTQQLKAIVLSETSEIIHQSSVHFDRDLPHYETTNGAVKGPDAGEVTSPVQMWTEAIDLLFQRLKDSNVKFASIAAISGAGQQHGSVYWSKEAEGLLRELDASQQLTEQLCPAAFSILRAPIWQDSSTSLECQTLEQEFGGAQALADCTGSRAYERFTGSQIARIRRASPEAYEATARISLVSSFISSLFLGRIAPIEISDASGMNLMNVLTCKWDEKLLDICGGPTLRAKLGPEPVAGGATLGKVSDWWVKRWGFDSDCVVAPFTGDNPATVVSLSSLGDALLSLGTSTTFLLSIPPAATAPKRFTTSHLLSHPTDPHGQVAMLCYKNGALAREQIRDRFANSDWNVFNTFLEQTPPGCNGILAFYFPLPEIIPPNVTGEFFFSNNIVETTTKPPMVLDDIDIPPSVHPRAIVESQFLSIKSRLAAMLPRDSHPLNRLVISGGSSANPTIRQMAADILGMDVFVSATEEAASMGGALLAKYAWWKGSHPGGSFEDMTDGKTIGLRCVAKTHRHVAQIYEGFLDAYNEAEKQLVKLWASKEDPGRR